MQSLQKPDQNPKYALVTGAQGGLGRAIFNKLISHGIKVILVDVDVRQLENMDHELIVHVMQCDLSKQEDIKEVWKALHNKKIIVDFLINNAGIYPACSWQDYTFDLANKVMNINLLSAFFMSQEFAQQTTQGSIVNISSIAAFTGGSDPIYGASKAAMIGLTKSLAISLAPKIRVNAIAPSAVNTQMMKNIPTEILQKQYRDRELLDQSIEPGAIADVVLFLAGAENISGSTIDVNNKMCCKGKG